MPKEDLREKLTQLPIEEEEVDVYLALLELGPSKARTVADQADIHRTTAYRILKEMGERGLVEVGVGRPMEFTPVPPERLFGQVRREKNRELELVDQLEEEVAPRLEELRSEEGATDPDDARWQMVTGRERIVEEAVGVLRTAEDELRYLSTESGAPERGDVDVDWESALAEKARELDVRILVDPSPIDEDVLEAFEATKGVELRYAEDGAQAQSILIDGEVFVWVVIGEDPQDDVALWSNAPDLYTSQRLLFDALWDGAKVVS